MVFPVNVPLQSVAFWHGRLTKWITFCDELEALKRSLHLLTNFVFESKLVMESWQTIVERSKTLSVRFVALCKPCKPCNHFEWRSSWWRHQMETFSALQAICVGNPSVTGEFSSQRSVTRIFGVFFALRLHKRLSKQSRRWWFKTPSCPLLRHRNVFGGNISASVNRNGWICFSISDCENNENYSFQEVFR